MKRRTENRTFHCKKRKKEIKKKNYLMQLSTETVDDCMRQIETF